jgi:hypothetical protein
VAEEAYRVVDEHGCLGGVGEVGGEKKDVVRVFDCVVSEEGFTGLGEFVGVSSDEDEFGARAAEAVREGKAKASGAAGDEDNTASV